MEDMKKFEMMLEQLAEQYPELEEQAMDLQSSLFDLSEPDIAKGEDEEMMDEPEDEASLEIEIEAPSEDGKSPIPPELMDEEEMPMPKKKK